MEDIIIAQEMDAWQTDIEVNGGIGKILQGAIETIDVEMNAGFFFMNGDGTGKSGCILQCWESKTDSGRNKRGLWGKL